MSSALLVTGASGFLAHRLLPLCWQHASRRSGRVVAVSRTAPVPALVSSTAIEWRPLGLLDADQVVRLMAEIRPDAVINAAAGTPGSPEAFMVNVDGAAAVARAAQEVGARLVHVSSDIVHAGDSAPYADDAAPTPINDYGRTKAEGESLVAEGCDRSVSVRASLIYSRERMDAATAEFARRLSGGESVRLWGDAIRHPVFADALVEGLLRLAFDLPDERGTINLAGPEAMSRAEYSTRLLRHWGAPTEGIVVGRAAAGHPLDLSLRLDRARLLGLPMVTTERALTT
ncbi:MAG: sugar nucleotide-binding protein [Actinomycetota bacterium]|nr:sugar nucleotide-binding protein [Actinomycetota bacterium]